MLSSVKGRILHVNYTMITTQSPTNTKHAETKDLPSFQDPILIRCTEELYLMWTLLTVLPKQLPLQVHMKPPGVVTQVVCSSQGGEFPLHSFKSKPKIKQKSFQFPLHQFNKFTNVCLAFGRCSLHNTRVYIALTQVQINDPLVCCYL